jgi:hypothetical protein
MRTIAAALRGPYVRFVPRSRVRRETTTRLGPRLPLDLQLRYRAVGATRWHEGRVENISRSGVLFRATDVVGVDEQVEITLILPVRRSARVIVCRARIVRTILPGGFEKRPGLAARISRYRFRRGEDGA